MVARVTATLVNFTAAVVGANGFAEIARGAGVAYAFAKRRAMPVAVASHCSAALVLTGVTNPSVVANTLAIHTHVAMLATAFHFVRASVACVACVTLASAIDKAAAVCAHSCRAKQATLRRKSTFDYIVSVKFRVDRMMRDGSNNTASTRTRSDAGPAAVRRPRARPSLTTSSLKNAVTFDVDTFNMDGTASTGTNTANSITAMNGNLTFNFGANTTNDLNNATTRSCCRLSPTSNKRCANIRKRRVRTSWSMVRA